MVVYTLSVIPSNIGVPNAYMHKVPIVVAKKPITALQKIKRADLSKKFMVFSLFVV
jgi:hypothetical protein